MTDFQKGDRVRWRLSSTDLDGEIIGPEPSLSTRYYRATFDRIGYVARVPETHLTKLTEEDA